MGLALLGLLLALFASACTGIISIDGEREVGPDAGAPDGEEDDPGQEPDPGYTTLDVPGTQTWTDTGIDVSAGELLEIAASGTVIFRASDTVGPDGFAPDDHDEWNELPCADHASLIGRIGRDGAPFPVGSQRWVLAPRAGRLYLGTNDRDVANNGGAFAVRIASDVPHDAPDTSGVTIPGNAGWVDSGIELDGSEIVAITASGTVDNNTRDAITSGPAGLPETPNMNANILKCANHAALLGRVGDTGAPFLVGELRSGPVPYGGRLQLGVNDSVVTDNAGKLAATITLLRP
ncbi:MAG TPA: hypothetical protein VKZ63_21935 [Kofleriaceae bacterium]|nr:hypothetical protein [Kofleriaceae bacterium]